MTKEWRIDIRATWSNIDQQFQVAMGRWDITLSDAKGWFHDLAVGNLIIKECWWIFVDVQTWWPISEKTEVAIGWNKDILQKFKEMIQDAYKWYNEFK